ncbi:MAG TPA: hypothetical protein VF834_24585 [Streptosporangiaceae bacterium]
MSLRQNTDKQPSASGGTSGLLRQAAQQRTSRRTMLRRGGIVAAASVASLTVLDQRRAEAATGNNFVLGNLNDANATTELHPTSGSPTLSPMFLVNGAALSGTSTSMVVDGPNAGQSLALQVNNSGGGLALQVNSASTSTTIGLAIQGNGAGTAGGISGSSGSGTGVAGSSTSGKGVVGTSSSNTGVSGVSTSGTGVGGTGKHGGVFTGTVAQIQLKPAATAHPHAGSKGDLFVDSSAHLWFCRGGTTWVKLA